MTFLLLSIINRVQIYYKTHVESIKTKQINNIEKRYSKYNQSKKNNLKGGSPLMTPALVNSNKSLTLSTFGLNNHNDSTSSVSSMNQTEQQRHAELVRNTGGIDYWPASPPKDKDGNYIIRTFDLRISKDPYLLMDDTEFDALEQLIRRVKHLKKYYAHTDRLTLLRFLRARKGDVDLAEDMFRHMVAWWDVNQLDTSLKTLQQLDYYPGGICGSDLNGDSVVWGKYGCIDPASLMQSYPIKDIQWEVARRYCLVHQIHRQNARLRNEPIEGLDWDPDNKDKKRQGRYSGLTGILDVSGLGLKHSGKAGYSALKLVLKISGLMFPETLNRAIIIRPPWVFYMIWAVIKLFIDSKTVQKIVVVSGNDPIKEIEKFVHRSQIPDWLGGDLVTRGTRAEDPLNWNSNWVDGVQKDGSRKGTLSLGGVLPKTLRKHKVSECVEKEMNFGDVNDPKYHI